MLSVVCTALTFFATASASVLTYSGTSVCTYLSPVFIDSIADAICESLYVVLEPFRSRIAAATA